MHSSPWESGSAPRLLVVSRFRVPVDERAGFAERMRHAVDVLAASPGFIDADLAESTDEADLCVLATTWESVGAYRRALSRYEVKAEAVPLLSGAVDEPSAYEVTHRRTTEGWQQADGGFQGGTRQ
jgi:quinol monooxygenase YgiN